MSTIETHQLVNGQYVPRRIPIHQIINQDRERGREEGAADDHIPRVQRPELGLLSKTIVRSPAVKWIFTARIRHPDLNDLVFVGEDHIQIVNIQRDGHLRYVGVKADFGSKIRSACVFGKRPEDEEPDGETLNMLKTGISPSQVTSPNPKASEMMPPQILVLSLASGELHFLFSAASDDHRCPHYFESSFPLPRQPSLFQQPGKHLAVDPYDRALAVASDSGIVLVYKLKNRKALQRQFEADKENWNPISEDVAISVNAVVIRMVFLYPKPEDDDYVVLLLFGSAQADRNGSRGQMFCYGWNHSRPIRQYHTILAGYVLGKGKLAIGLHCVFLMLTLEAEELAHPDLIIPSSFSPSFILVSHHDMFLINDLLISTPSIRRVSGPGPVSPPNRWARSERLPIFTAWVKAHRHHPNWKDERHEIFYLVREDGVLNLIDILPSGLMMLHPAGHASCHAATAFACFLVGNKYRDPDMFALVGDMSQGEVLLIGSLADNFDVRAHENAARAEVMAPRKHESLLNWSPVLDQVLIPAEPGNGLGPHDRQSICFTSGTQPFGALSELRIGLEALISTTVSMDTLDLGPDDLSGAMGLWIVPNSSDSDQFAFISLPGTTIAFNILSDQDAFAVLGDSGAITTEETLLVARIKDSWIIQVTPHSIVALGELTYKEIKDEETRMGGGEDTVPTFEQSIPVQLPANCYIMLAAFDEPSSLLLTILQSNAEVHIQLHAFTQATDHAELAQLGNGIRMPYQPTSLSTAFIRSTTLVFVGTRDDRIHVYYATAEALSVISEYELTANYDHKSASGVEATAIVIPENSSTETQEAMLICSLRDGSIRAVLIEISLGNIPKISWNIPKSFEMGLEAVKLLSDPVMDPSSVIAVCGPDVVHLSYKGGREIGLQLSSIWFIDKMKESEPQPTILKVCLAPVRKTNRLHSIRKPIIAGLTNTELLVAYLDDVVKTLPRRRLLEAECFQGDQVESSGLPRSLLYSPTSDALLIGTAIWEHRFPSKLQAPLPMHTGKRVLRPGLCVATVHRSEPEHDSDDNFIEPIPVLHLFARQRILAMTLWNYGGEHLVLGMAVYRKDRPIGGKLLFFKLGTKDDLELELTKESKTLAGPIRALSEFRDPPDMRPSATNPPKLVVCQDKTLQVYAYDTELQKIRPQESTELPSPAIHITCHSPYIYVTTAADSLQIYKYSVPASEQFLTYKLELVSSDSIARRGACHLAIRLPSSALASPSSEHSIRNTPTEEAASSTEYDPTLPNILLTADRAGALVGLEPGYGHKYQVSARTLFECSLPQPITKLVQGNIRPPWRRIQSAQSGVLADNIVGSTADGTFYSLSIIDPKARVLLKFLENLCAWSKQERGATALRRRLSASSASSSSGTTSPQITIDPERDSALHSGLSARRKTHNHVDGDALECLLLVGGRARLKEMLQREGAVDDPSERYRGNDVQTRIRRFREVVEAARGQDVLSPDQAVDWVVEWLRDVMTPLL